MQQTVRLYEQVIDGCREIFKKKTQDYGSAWRILRLPSLTDQILIKAHRIRSLQEKKQQKIDEGQTSEFAGIVNYCIMALIQLQLKSTTEPDLSAVQALDNYNLQVQKAVELMKRKNHDYGEAWKNLRISSLTDLILQKLLRIKQIEDNEGQTLISEGVDANYLDIINYAVFALILFEWPD